MKITLREFMKKLSLEGHSLAGWGLRYDSIDLLVTEVPNRGDIRVVSTGEGIKHKITPENWEVVSVDPRSLRSNRTTLIVR